jgi:hypothetical protein
MLEGFVLSSLSIVILLVFIFIAYWIIKTRQTVPQAQAPAQAPTIQQQPAPVPAKQQQPAPVPAPAPTKQLVQAPAPTKPTPVPPAPAPPQEKQPEKPLESTVKSIAETTVTLVKDPNLYIAVGADLVLRQLIVKATQKATRLLVAKTVLKIEQKLLTMTARVLERIGAKAGAEMLSRLGLRAGEKAGVKAAQLAAEQAAKAGVKAGVKAAETGATVGAELSAQSTAAASTGPAAPFVEAGLLAFDVLSIGLDIGDAGGYGQMSTLEEYRKIKEGIDAELKKAYAEQGGTYPGIVGPLDKLSADDYKQRINDEVTKIMSSNDPLIKPMKDAIASDIKENILTEADLEDDTKMQDYINLIDMDVVFAKASNNLCTTLGGKTVDVGDNNLQCSYRDRQSCESSYSWPLKEDSNETYAEYKDDQFGGSCINASYALRGICETAKIGYNTQTGLCNIDETYCKSKGADWKDGDCHVNRGQEVAELLFGTTITRGLKQIFDPAQYSPCDAGEIDDGYFCRRLTCPDDREEKDSLCYPRCTKGFHPFGCCICSPDCPDGWTDDGATCRKVGCNGDQDHDGALCYPKCKPGYSGIGPVCWEQCKPGYVDDGAFCRKPIETYGRGVGRIPDKRGCDAGQRDDGTSCWLDTYGRGAGRIPDKGGCDAGQRDDGTSCWEDWKCAGGWDEINWGLFGTSRTWNALKNCGGCGCIKKTLFDRQSCHDDEEKNGALCYPKCKSGYHAVGCCLCEPDGGPGIKKTLFDRQFCHDDEELNGGLCYPKCKEGYTADGCCICRKGGDVYAKQSYGRGAGTPDTTIVGKPNTSYGRGVGTVPKIDIHAKRRVIPFSAKS